MEIEAAKQLAEQVHFSEHERVTPNRNQRSQRKKFLMWNGGILSFFKMEHTMTLTLKNINGTKLR